MSEQLSSEPSGSGRCWITLKGKAMYCGHAPREVKEMVGAAERTGDGWVELLLLSNREDVWVQSLVRVSAIRCIQPASPDGRL